MSKFLLKGYQDLLASAGEGRFFDQHREEFEIGARGQASSNNTAGPCRLLDEVREDYAGSPSREFMLHALRRACEGQPVTPELRQMARELAALKQQQREPQQKPRKLKAARKS